MWSNQTGGSKEAETHRRFPFQDLASSINSAHICTESYPLKQWQRFMITFEQWSTSWNIYIQSFSYRTVLFYNTFLIQCHLVKHKMPIWNSEILAVPAGVVLNTYLDPFHYSHPWSEALSWPFWTLGFDSFQSYLVLAFYNSETSISFPPTLKYKVSACGSNILHIQTFSHFLKRNILERNWKRTHQKFTLFTRDYLVFIIPLRMGIGFSSENNFWAPSMGW